MLEAALLCITMATAQLPGPGVPISRLRGGRLSAVGRGMYGLISQAMCLGLYLRGQAGCAVMQ